MARWLIAFLLLLAPSLAHAQRGPLERQNNLSDLDNAATALSNLGANNASNLSTGTLPAARLPASGATAGTYGTATTVPQITVDAAGRITAAGNVAITGGGGSAAIFSPQGRLTLTSGSPVMSADVVGATTIYYDDYSGNALPIYNGTASAMYPITSGQLSLALNATDEPIGALYDVFAVNVAGAATLCAAPDWSSLTARSIGVTLTVTGYWTNAAATVHCYAGATDEGAVAANEGTYLGTFYTTAAGATTMQFQPAAAAGGSGCTMGLFNSYNRTAAACTDSDSNNSWAYAANTWRPADGSTANAVTFVDGLGQSWLTVDSRDAITPGSTGAGNIGSDLDSTSARPVVIGQVYVPTAGNQTTSAHTNFPPVLGLHTVTEVEASPLGVNVTFYGFGRAGYLYLTVSLGM